MEHCTFCSCWAVHWTFSAYWRGLKLCFWDLLKFLNLLGNLFDFQIQDTNFLWRKFLALPQALSFNFQPKSTNSSRLCVLCPLCFLYVTNCFFLFSRSPWQKWCQEWYHYWTKITLRYNRIWKPSGLVCLPPFHKIFINKLIS